MSGSTASDIHYDVFARMPDELMFRIFGIPMISYSDDFGALPPDSLAIRGVEVCTQWWQLVGIPLKLKKSEVGARITSLGLLVSFPTSDGGMRLRITLTPENPIDGRILFAATLGKGRVPPPNPKI